jgi:hypothetical protein
LALNEHSTNSFAHRWLQNAPLRQRLPSASGNFFHSQIDASALGIEQWRLLWAQDPQLPRVANLARDYLHARASGGGAGFCRSKPSGPLVLPAYGLTPALYRKRCSNLPD